MIEHLYLTNQIVEDQDEALRFYIEKKTDEPLGPDARFITVASEQDETVEIFLKPVEGTDRQAAKIGHQQTLAFTVDDCHAMYDTLRERGVEFTSEPEELPYGIRAVARDLYGNGVALVEHAPDAKAR